MAQLTYSAGGEVGRRFQVREAEAVLGRQHDCDIVLPLPVVSRRHARIIRDGGDYYIEDLGSTNGTYVNGELVSGRRLLSEGDRIGIDRIVLNFGRDTDGSSNLVEDNLEESDVSVPRGEPNVRAALPMEGADDRYDVNAEAKLRALVQMIRQFNTVDSVDAKFERLVDAAAEIFPQADRIYVLTNNEESRLQLRAYRFRESVSEDTTMPLISRSVARQAMAEGQALLIDDAVADERFHDSGSVFDGQVRSVICAPLKPSMREAIGVLHVDTSNAASLFTQNDLDVLASMASIAADVLELGRLHELQVQSQRLAAIGQAMAVVSHESRNSLQVFKLGLGRLQEKLGDDSSLAGTVEAMLEAEAQLGQLLEEVQAFAGPLVIERQPIELRGVWRRAWESLAGKREGRDAELTDATPDVDTMMQGDPRRLEQVFRNLFENSLSASKDPVRISVACEATRYEDSPAFSVSVRDNGPGMTLEQRQKVFDPFFTTRSEGVGLGMSIVRRIITAHDGQIIAAPGGPGAEFRISLPCESKD